LPASAAAANEFSWLHITSSKSLLDIYALQQGAILLYKLNRMAFSVMSHFRISIHPPFIAGRNQEERNNAGTHGLLHRVYIQLDRGFDVCLIL
jgi:hypothetical protein